MSRSERLLQLMQILRRYRYPVSGAALAQELGISLRSVYRDIASLQAQGARIEGEAGLGYVLQPGFTLPPLMFSSEEAEAIALGLRWVTAAPTSVCRHRPETHWQKSRRCCRPNCVTNSTTPVC